MPFAIPMVWREEKDHMESYFCIINLKGINHKKKHYVQYTNVHLAIRLIPHGPDLPVPEPDGDMEYNYDPWTYWHDCHRLCQTRVAIKTKVKT